MTRAFKRETVDYDLPHKGYNRTMTVHFVVKNITLLILSANDRKAFIHPLTSKADVVNIRPVHTIPL